MELATPFNALENTTSDIWRIHHLNYKVSKKANQNYWEKECIDHPTSTHCKVYKSKFFIDLTFYFYPHKKGKKNQ